VGVGEKPAVDDDSIEKTISVDGLVFRAHLVKRPFREGVEVRIETSQGVVTLAELGLGERAMLERAAALIRSSGLKPK
jgi:hypothetical protein